MNFVKHYRKLRKLTQVDLAKRVKTHQAKIQRIEQGQKVSIELASYLSQALAIPLENLFPGCAPEKHAVMLPGTLSAPPETGGSAKWTSPPGIRVLDVHDQCIALEINSVYRGDSAKHWLVDNYTAKIVLEDFGNNSSRNEAGSIQIVKLCFSQAMNEGWGWLNLMNADHFIANVGGVLTDSGFGWSRKTIKAVGRNETSEHDVLLIKSIELCSRYSGAGLDLWGIWVAAAKLGAGLVGLVPLSVTNLYHDVQEVATRSGNLRTYFGGIGFKPVTDEILAMPAYRKPLDHALSPRPAFMEEAVQTSPTFPGISSHDLGGDAVQ